MSEGITLFLHSTGTTPQLWAGIPPAPGTTAVRPANVGYPPNDPLPRGVACTLDDELAHLRPQLADAERIHVVAHSYGAVLALALAQTDARIASLALFEPVLFGALRRAPDLPSDVAAEVRAFEERPGFVDDDELGGTAPWLEHFVDYWNRPGSWARAPEPVRAYSLAHGWKMYQEVRVAFFGYPSFEEAAPPALPTTLLVGSRTTAASREMTARLAAHTPGARVVTIEGTGHMAPLTHPALVGPVLSEHLS